MADRTLELFQLDSASSEPPFRQIRDLVVAAVSDGRLSSGARLPTVRSLATHLGVAANTVASAYRALEEQCIAEGRGRAGTFIAAVGDPVEAAAAGVAREAARQLTELGVAGERAIALLTEAVRKGDDG
ncbi:GntR family transcriptional regulator [Leucobacter sp. USHLN153]|uniref:GntR family transcriptional regulator n=1 Tax=Leucobacter sp. USHLN153 TaxID=3081268 RepID=UPI0030196924